jgi:hypothetical protein
MVTRIMALKSGLGADAKPEIAGRKGTSGRHLAGALLLRKTLLQRMSSTQS